MLDLDLNEDEMHFVALKMLNPNTSGNQNLHYPTLVKWMNNLANSENLKIKDTSNFKPSERYY